MKFRINCIVKSRIVVDDYLNIVDVLDTRFLVVMGHFLPRNFVDFELVISSSLFKCRFSLLEVRSMVPARWMYVSKRSGRPGL
jgi:hypothetical protein